MWAKFDSVTAKWTAVGSGMPGKSIIDGTKDSIPFTTTCDADSSISTSRPYPMSADPKAPKVTFRSVGRMKVEKFVGTSMNMLADKPDSVVARGRFEATNKPE